MKLVIRDITGEFAVDAKLGDQVHDSIKAALRTGEFVEISFVGLSTIISAFLHPAVGQLFGDFSPEEIAAKVTFTGLTDEDDRRLLDRVIERAKLYYSNPDVKRVVDAQGSPDA